MSEPTIFPDDDEERDGTGMPAQLSMVVFAAQNLPALRRYYQALGWPERPGASDGLCTFELGGAALTLYPQSERLEPQDAAIAAAVTLVVRVEARHEVDAACSAAFRAGAHSIVEAQDHPWGGRSAIVADPEGNRWEVLFVPAPSSEKGNRPAGSGPD